MRLKGVLAVAAVTIAAATSAMFINSNAFAIVGGTPAQQSYPFIVNLTLAATGDFPELHRCGAALVAPQWAVTAAHCVDGPVMSELVARVGSNDRTQGGEVRDVVQEIIHPRWRQDDTLHGDIALIKLSAPVTAEPIRLASAAQSGMKTQIVGWGLTCSDDVLCTEKPVMLQQLDTVITATSDCADIDGATELCTGDPAAGSGACQGDSGGPQLVLAEDGTWRLVGVTSRSGHGETTCGDGPTIYTSVPAYADWIAENLTGQTT
jgi:secreted trypsin-like serine protease